MTPEQQVVKIAKLGSVYRPGTPIDKFALFAGRQKQVKEIIRAINLPGQHVVIFGERGVGKTSLSRILVELLTLAGIDVISPDNINCDGTDDFSRIWIKVFRELFELMKTRNRETPREIKINEEAEFYDTPDDVRFVLSRLPHPAIIILDEVDRITNEETTTLLADTIKNLSDHATQSTLILIGVADSIDDLVSEHRSIERAIVQVHLPRMSVAELREIIEKGAAHAEITFEQDAADQIVKLSTGLPYYTHTLALYAAEHAIEADRSNVLNSDVTAAIHQLVDKPGNLLSMYEKATSSGRVTLYGKVLLACALAQKSDLGYFSAADVRVSLELISGKHYKIPAFAANLDAFCSERRGNVIQKSGQMRRYRFRFDNPLLQPFVIIHALAKGIITSEKLALFDQFNDNGLFAP